MNNKIIILLMCWIFLVPAMQAQGLRILFIGDSVTDGNFGKVNGGERSLSDYNHTH